MTIETPVDLIPFDDPAFRADPYPFYAEARIQAPVYRSPLGVWVFTRYAEVSKLLYDRSLTVEQIEFGPASPLHDSALGADAPRHTALRRALNKWFTPKAVQVWREHAQRHLDDALTGIVERGGEFDAVMDIAYPVTFLTVCDLMGVPPLEAIGVRQATYDLGAGLGTNPSDDEVAGVADAMHWFSRHAEHLIDLNLAASRDGLLSSLLEMERLGDLTRDEVVGTLTLIFAVGHLDIGYLIVHGLHIFAEHPDVAAAYRDDAALRPAIVEEVLRVDTPEQFVTRMTTTPITIGEVEIPAGEILTILISAANKDPEVFPNPDLFDYRRDNSKAKHLAFGGGLHGCAGQVLARAEAEVVFRTITERFGGVRPAGPVVYGHTDFIRSITHLPLTLSSI
ncbi:cytochrome P450 [Herbiconiux daphne]|uniref:Cytochrome P450 n=1 Tax=Herbiconiux daphne TaxID=2970914 RepID=A0ABT2H6Z4_9MICO|nr:cytochrome P450 [Herbiconiux daphne]MCS5735684.1 cytochrome P450 [Herbiconiux daphne]